MDWHEAEHRQKAPETTPVTSILEDPGQPEREQPRATLVSSPTPVPHPGPAGHVWGGENSLKMSAVYLLPFVIYDIMKIWRKRMTE